MKGNTTHGIEVELPQFDPHQEIQISLAEIQERRFDLIDRYGDRHMLDRNDDRTVNANVAEVLEALHKNLEEHKEIVAEARVGYVAKCKVALEEGRKKLEKRIAALDDTGKVSDGMMDHILFQLIPPEDHSKEFETVIKMLELHANAHVGCEEEPYATIELKATDVQRFVLNDWKWMDTFLMSNSGYSGKSMALAADKGLL
jgi:hypothetical protein